MLFPPLPSCSLVNCVFVCAMSYSHACGQSCETKLQLYTLLTFYYRRMMEEGSMGFDRDECVCPQLPVETPSAACRVVSYM